MSKFIIKYVEFKYRFRKFNGKFVKKLYKRKTLNTSLTKIISMRAVICDLKMYNLKKRFFKNTIKRLAKLQFDI